MYEMTVSSGTPQRRGGWREEHGEGRGRSREEQGRRGGRDGEGKNCGGDREEDEVRRPGGRDDEGRRTGGSQDENGGRRGGGGREDGGRRGGREETEGRRVFGREEDRKSTVGRKEQKGGIMREDELVRKMEECGLGSVTDRLATDSRGLGAVRRLEVRGGRALFTPQVFHNFTFFVSTNPGCIL